MTSWGSWDYSGGNGMRVGLDWDVASVSNGSTSVKITIDIWTENQYTYGDSQKLTYGSDLDGSTSFTNNDGGSPQKRATKTLTHTYGSSSYGSSPGTWKFSAKISGAYNGVTPSESATVTIPARPYAAPPAPTTCAAARVSDTSTNVTWVNKATAGAPYDAVWVERYVYNYATWARVATLAGSATSYADTGVVANRKYAHRVQANNGVGTSAYAQSGDIYTTPAAPAAAARVQSGTNQVVTWTLAVGYTEYETEVWRSVNSVWTLLATVASGVTTYTDTTSSASTKVKYRLRVKTTVGTVLYSAYSADTTETVGVLTAPSAPTLMVPSGTTADPSDPIQFTWKHNPTDASAQSAYQVQYRYVGDSTWIQTGKITSTSSSWTMPANTVNKGRQVEWQVQTWGASSTLVSPFSATTTWTTSAVVAVKYPLVLDLLSGRTEADSQAKLAKPSATWGVAPLDKYGTDQLSGREIYVDSAGLLRSKPADLTAAQRGGVWTAAASPGSWPYGVTTLQISAATGAADGWPYAGSGIVVTIRRAGDADGSAVATQTFYRNSTLAAQYQTWTRFGSGGSWGPWFLGGVPDTGWIDGSPYFTATSNFTVTDNWVRQVGNIVYVWIKGTAKWTSNSPTSGDITNTQVLNIAVPFQPSAPVAAGGPIEQFLGSSASGREVHWSVYAATISAVSQGGSSAIATGDPLSISGSYLL